MCLWACGRACTHLHMFMWIWAEAIIKVLNSRFSGLWSKQCPDKVCAFSACWSSAFADRAHKNAKISRFSLSCYALFYIPFLFISSFNYLFRFSLFAKWMGRPPHPSPSFRHTNHCLLWQQLKLLIAGGSESSFVEMETIDSFSTFTPIPTPTT